jgi:hypothetical protein
MTYVTSNWQLLIPGFPPALPCVLCCSLACVQALVLWWSLMAWFDGSGVLRLGLTSLDTWHILLVDMTWCFFITMPCPIESSYLCTQREYNHEAICSVVIFTWMSFETYLSLHCCLMNHLLSCNCLIEKSELVMVFGDTPMSNFTSRTFWYRSQHFFNLACFQHTKQRVSSEKAPIHPLYTLTS